MNDKKHALEDPMDVYGKKRNLNELEFIPMSNMMETLKGQGCITLDDFVAKFSKYL